LQTPEEYVKSGRITREVRAVVADFVKPGRPFVEVCELVEKEVHLRGGKLAFPTGIGVNQVTAHFAPQGDDRSKVEPRDVVKVDFGVHVDGYVTDTAVTTTSNPDYGLMLEAAQKALDAAIETAKRDLRLGEIGRSIYREASRLGFRTIENLTGHTVDRYVVHAGKSIPNLYLPGLSSLKSGDVFAIEPFVTPASASGYVVDAPSVTIFSIVSRKKTGERDPEEFVERIWEDRKTLPFTPSWYAKEWSRQKVESMLKVLAAKRIVHSYPTLVEASGNPVAQFEHTMALEDGGLVVLT